MLLGTGGHSTVENVMEDALLHDLRRRWFDRYLKGIPNGVDAEALVEAAMQPESDALHLDPTTIWEHRQSAQWPTTTGGDIYHLVGSNALQLSPPVASNASNVIDHVVPAGYDINAYIDLGGVGPGAGREPTTVVANIPPSNESFVSLPLVAPIEILGRPTVKLTVNDTTGTFQLTAMLGHTDPFGTTHWITAGTAGVRSGVAGMHEVEIELGDVGQIVPDGHSLALKITNLADIDAPSSRRIRMVPYFESTTTTIAIDPARDNFLDLPMRFYTADLLPRLANASASAGIAHTMELRGGPLHALQNYFVAIGCSGEAPGFAIGTQQVPLNFDACTALGLSAFNTPLLPNTMGTFDFFGNAPPPGFALPPAVAPLFAGFRLTFVGFVLNAVGDLDVLAGPATLRILP